MSSARGFEASTININQTLPAKLARDGQTNLPYRRANLYAWNSRQTASSAPAKRPVPTWADQRFHRAWATIIMADAVRLGMR